MPIAGGGPPISTAAHGTLPQAPAAPAATTANDPVLLYTQYPIQNEWEWNSAGTSLPRNTPLTGQNSGWPTWQYNDGYDANATRPQGTRRAAAVNAANAIITDGLSTGSHQMSVFVTDIEIDTALGGTTAQSQMTRDFYPRNFIQPSFVVSGVSMDQNDYALLCEFIHSAQQKAVKGTNKDLTQLYVMGRDPDPKKTRGWDGSYTTGRRVMISQPGNLMKSRLRDPDNSKVAQGTYVNQHTRGSHQPIVAKGYVATMPRIHQQFTYATTWKFNFVVAAMLSGIYSERTPMAPTVQKTWANMLADAQAQGVVSFSNAANKSLLSYAASHDTIDGTLITGSNTPTAAGGSSTGGSPSSGTPTPTGSNIIMYDTAGGTSSIPANPQAVAGYIDGNYQTYSPLVSAFPNAHHLSITVLGGIADCLDIEPGNAIPPSGAGAWAMKVIAADPNARPCLYADGSDMPGVQSSLQSVGLSRSQYRLWLAQPTGSQHLASGYDATQYLWAGGYDASACLSNFFS